jgi:predicted CopG family antitoxin
MIALENDEMPKTTILIETKTREELRLMGIKGESYDDIIRRLIDHWRKTKK